MYLNTRNYNKDYKLPEWVWERAWRELDKVLAESPVFEKKRAENDKLTQ